MKTGCVVTLKFIGVCNDDPFCRIIGKGKNVKQYINTYNSYILKYMSAFLLFGLILSLTGCKQNQKSIEDNTNPLLVEYQEVYVPDSIKADWYDALVKLISNQEEAYGTPQDGIIGYEAPRPNDPSIAAGCDMGLFDVNLDGVPELLLNLGGGSAGNDYFYIYDIISGKQLGTINGGSSDAWAVYYDTINNQYITVGRYDWRSGDSGSSHFVKTIIFDEEEQRYCEKSLFYSSYEYDKVERVDENGDFSGIDLEIADVAFGVNGESAGFQSYHYALTEFYQKHCLVPNTGVKLYYWSDVSDMSDSYQERAEKMAQMLLYGSGQKFIYVGN